ncbi:MAG TPA: hypothetical protein VE972_09175 [Conexibacter sp.]|nr:hypothetical protein [Conexibacter sp.]
MSNRTKACLVLGASISLLAVGAASATATIEKLIFAHSGEVTASGTATFTAGEVTVRCRLTLTASLNREITPTRGEALGSVPRAVTSGCEGGERPSVTFLAPPSTLAYSSVSGSEPEALTAVLMSMNGTSVNIASGRLSCLYRGEVGLSAALSGANPYPVGTLSTLANSLSLVRGEGCARTGSIRASLSLAAENWLIEALILELAASPRTVTRAQAQSGVAVTFTPTTMTVRPTTGRWRDGANGWTTDVTPCLTTIMYPTGMCQLTLTATATAGTNMLQLINGSNVVVGQVPVTP